MLNTAKCKVLVVDPHPVVREGLVQTVGRDPDLEVCGSLATVQELFEAIPKLSPSLVTLELDLGHADGLELIKILGIHYPELPVLVISRLPEVQYAERALRAGARGFLSKARPCTCILHALHAVAEGGVWISSEVAARMMQDHSADPARVHRCPLTDRELQVYRLIGLGVRTGAIAKELGVSVKTVETYRLHLKTKLGLRNGAELTRRAQEWLERGCTLCGFGSNGAIPLDGQGFCSALVDKEVPDPAAKHPGQSNDLPKQD